MTMDQEPTGQNKGDSGCLKIAGIGCALFIGMVILVVVVVMFRFDSIMESQWFRDKAQKVESAKAEVQNMLDLREGLLVDYPADEINIQANIKSGDAGSTRTLTLRFVNPDFDLPEDRLEREAAAREIALVIAQRFPDLEKYDDVSIAFDKGGSVVVDSERYTFDVDELPRSDVPPNDGE